MGPPSKPPATENFSRRRPILSRFGCMDARQMEGQCREKLFFACGVPLVGALFLWRHRVKALIKLFQSVSGVPQTTATALYKILALQKSDFTISNVITVKTEVFCSNRLKDGASLQATRHRELFPAQAHFVAFWLHGRAANGGPAPGKSLFACIVVRLPFDREISFQGHLPHFVGGSANFVFLPIFRLTSGR